jgi:DNA-binding NarL/FixJ family response regulator
MIDAQLRTSPAVQDAAVGMIRTLIVGGHPLLRWALRRISEEYPDLHAIGEADNAMDAVNLTFSLQPDVVTIDCAMPEGQGWVLARELRAKYPNLGIVILGADTADEFLFRALDAGASAYLSKDASVHEVLGAVRHAAVAADSFSAAGLAGALRRRRETSDRLSLSPRERQVLSLLRDGHSVPQVAATIYVSLSTAKTYVARLYEKLGASNRAQALMTAVELGLFEGEHHSVAALAG